MPMAWTRREAAVMFQRMVEERHREMGRTVERLRKSRGWSQPDLSRESGVSVGTISRLENGRHEGRTHTVRAVAKALGVTVQEILPMGETEPEELSQLDRIEAKLDQLLAEIRLGLGDRLAALDAREGSEPAPKRPRTPPARKTTRAA